MLLVSKSHINMTMVRFDDRLKFVNDGGGSIYMTISSIENFSD